MEKKLRVQFLPFLTYSTDLCLNLKQLIRLQILQNLKQGWNQTHKTQPDFPKSSAIPKAKMLTMVTADNHV